MNVRPTKLVAVVLAVAGASVMAALTPEGLRKDLDAVTTAALFEKTWGLVCPESSVPVAEIKGLTAEQHPDLTVLPEQARFESGALVFTLGETAAVVGAWNYENRLAKSRRPDLGHAFDIEMEIEQSVPDKTVWTMIPWYDGQRPRLGAAIAKYTAVAQERKLNVEEYLQETVYRLCRREVVGTGRQVVKIEGRVGFFKDKENMLPFDGIELEIKGPAGAIIKIHRLAIAHKARKGGFRKEFTLPTGAVWRAVGNVGRKTLLYVNGVEVPNNSLLATRPHPHRIHGQQLQEVDLKPYLKPGRNVMAAYPAGDNALLQASVVMVSGEAVELNTDPTWRYVPALVQGWDAPAFAGDTVAITNTMPFSAGDLPANLTAIRYGYRLYMQYSHSQPAYAGRLLLQAPDDDQLYFSADRPFRMRARSPAGLAALKPAVEWLLCQYVKGGALAPALSGTAAAFSSQGDSLEFELDGGGAKLPAGAYVIKTVLRGTDGTVLEDRIPEPCLVTGRIPMAPTPGRTYTDGLSLEKEAVIDFTKPDDPQFPWMEIDGKAVCTNPIVVTRNGLTYRETRMGSSDYGTQVLITHNYAFKHPGDFYLMELEYPDDQPRFFGVGLCSEHDGRGDHSKAGPSVWTGIWHLNTGRMQNLTWLFRPDPGYTSINLINMLAGSAAAASKLTISRVQGRLPELQTGGNDRHFGILMESARSYSGFGKTFRSSDNPQTATHTILDLGSEWAQIVKTNRPVQVRLAALAEWLDTCTRYTEYQRWAGQNLMFLAFFQYDGSSINAEPPSATGDSRVVPHITDIAARVFRDNGIDFFLSIEYCSDPILLARHRVAPADLSNSPYLINREGREARIWSTGFNFNHPEVRQSMLDVAGEAVRKYRRLPNFRGVNFTTSFSGCMIAPNYFTADDREKIFRYQPEPLRFDYSDATLRRFEKDTGVKLPVPADAPDRFERRHKLLTADALREQWIEWRAQNMLNFFIELRDRLRQIKPDVKVVTGNASPGFISSYAVNCGQTAEQAMRAFGWDYGKFHAQEGIYTMPWLQGMTQRRYGYVSRDTTHDAYQSYLKLLKENTPAYLKIGDGAVERMAMIKYGWLELERGAQALLPKRPHWQVPYQYTMEGAPQGDNALAPYLAVMAAIDPDSTLYGFTDTNLKIGGEQPLREFAQFLRSLPKAKFQPLTGPDTELLVRTLRQDGKLLFYALNPAPWPVKATITLKDTAKVTNLISGEEGSPPVTAVIPAYHGVSFAAAGNAAVSGWQTAGAGELFPRYVQSMTDSAKLVGARLENPTVNSVLLPDQKQTLKRILQDTQQALGNKQFARAWQLLNSWDFIWCAYFLDRQSIATELVTEPDAPPPNLGQRTIIAPRAEIPPAIDGQLDDPAWKQAAPQGGFIETDGKASIVGTEVRVAWDKQKLYLGFACRDKFPKQLKQDARQEVEVMRDDALVFLLQPNRQSSRHFQLAFNPAGVKFDQQDKDYAFAPDWKVAVQVSADGWTAEAAFPFAALEVKPEAGMKWGANFCRIFRMNQVPASTWSYMPGGWHNPAGYGVLEFK